MVRLRGRFATIALFANQKDLLIAARRGSPLAIGVSDDNLIVGSDTEALGILSHQVIQLSEGSPAVLCSVKTALPFSQSSQLFVPPQHPQH
jgi:glutamine---fructose-6-phosphate transaminase (isomerizing)